MINAIIGVSSILLSARPSLNISTACELINGSMNEMAAGASEINNAVQEINDEIVQITDNLNVLSKNVGSFKL